MKDAKTAIKASLAVILGLGLGFSAQPACSQQLAQDSAVAALSSMVNAQALSQGSNVQSQAQAVNNTQALNNARAGTSNPPVDLRPSGAKIPDVKPVESQAAPRFSEPQPMNNALLKDDPPALISKDKKELSSPKMPDSVKSVVKRLNTATEGVTLDDLNSAREAVAKLDMLIDIEKRLKDLADLRQEREEKSMAGAIPASALGLRGGLPPPVQPFPASMEMENRPPPMPVVATANVEVTRIVGAAGRYMATVKVNDGKSMTVRQGDKLSDGSVVQDITSRSVTLVRDKKTHTVNVKDIAVVFNGRS
jgi:type IV pilus biogenesis protein PilP